MKLIRIVLLAGMLAITSTAGARDLSDHEYGELLKRIYDGRSGSAATFLDSLATYCDGEPFYLIARARLQLEAVPEDDLDKSLAKGRTEPVLAILKEVIDICDERLDAGGNELALRRLRGWAWMVRSQAHAQGRSFYAAGREAGRGKNDLEFYLAEYPADPVANGLLGAFLYFTDAVPAIFQFLSKLIFLPTGDRARGLEMIELARIGPGPKQEDFRTLKMTVDVVFEGRWEEGLPQALALQADYPAYTRASLPLAALRLLAPGLNGDLANRLARTEALAAELPSADVDSASLWMSRAYQAWADRLLLGPARAEPGFARIAAAAPARPDWINEFAERQLAELELDRKDGLPDTLIARVWQSSPEHLTSVMAKLSAEIDTAPRAAFYAAECQVRLGNLEEALPLYRRVVADDEDDHLAPYRLVAASRVAELKARAGRYRAASRWYKRAVEHHRDVYRVDWMLEGRARRFDEMNRRGEALDGPSILFAKP